jgi:hypothetical protein
MRYVGSIMSQLVAFRDDIEIVRKFILTSGIDQFWLVSCFSNKETRGQ